MKVDKTDWWTVDKTVDLKGMLKADTMDTKMVERRANERVAERAVKRAAMTVGMMVIVLVDPWADQ